MQEKDRQFARKRLDKEMRHYRLAAREPEPTAGLLRAVRQVLGVPVAEITAKMGVCRSVVCGLEASEVNKSIMLGSMARMADAMGCKLVYGIVPKDGKTLEELAEERMWRNTLKDREQGRSS